MGRRTALGWIVMVTELRFVRPRPHRGRVGFAALV
jgi:hypothetical protein